MNDIGKMISLVAVIAKTMDGCWPEIVKIFASDPPDGRRDPSGNADKLTIGHEEVCDYYAGPSLWIPVKLRESGFVPTMPSKVCRYHDLHKMWKPIGP